MNWTSLEFIWLDWAVIYAANPQSGFVMGSTDEAFGSMVKFVLPAGIKGVVTVVHCSIYIFGN